MSQRDIAATIEDIYGFQMSHEQISTITGRGHGRGRGMAESSAPVVLSICFRRLHLRIVSISEYGVQQVAVWRHACYDVNGCKDVLGLWINETESKHAWMQIFDEPRTRGVTILASCPWMASGLEEGAKAVFPHATVQRRIVHLIRNSIRYIPRKQWSAFTKQWKLIYGAINVGQARQNSRSSDRLAGLSRRGQRMGKQFLTRRAVS